MMPCFVWEFAVNDLLAEENPGESCSISCVIAKLQVHLLVNPASEDLWRDVGFSYDSGSVHDDTICVGMMFHTRKGN